MSQPSMSFFQTRQRAIYSEVINPENSVMYQDMSYLPDITLNTTMKQRVPKAYSLKKTTNTSRLSGAHSIQKISEELVVEPKVLEPYEPIGDNIPRKVAINRKQKLYASFNILQLLDQEGIDLNMTNPQVQWLPLELFDDNSNDDYPNEDWIKRKVDEEGRNRKLYATCLLKEDGIYEARRCEILEFLDGLFHGKLKEKDGRDFKTHRLYICFDAEDPRKFVKRLGTALKNREHADSRVRYNYFIDGMPIQDLSELDTEQKRRLEQLAKTKKLENLDTTALIAEVNYDYMRTMNKIIFDRYLEYEDEELNLQIDEDISKQVPYYGMFQVSKEKQLEMYNPREITQIDPKNFRETFKDFCFSTLFIKTEVIRALQEIRYECNKMQEFEIFNYQIDKVMVLEEFKHVQESSISQMLYSLRGSWIQDLLKIMKTYFSGVGKGWFNMKESNKITYDFGKLKRFLTVVRLMMQDTVQSLVENNYKRFVNYLKQFIPDEVNVDDPSNIINKFKTVGVKPIFTIDMIKTNDDKEFLYSTSPINFVNMIIQLFDKTLDEITKVPDLEPKLLTDLYKQKTDSFIKTPVKPKERPQTPNPNERPKKYPDENKWIWLLIEHIKDELIRGIKPLQDYLQIFEKFKPILQMNPDDEIRRIEMDDNPWEIDQIKEEIFKYNKMEEELKTQIPDIVEVSIFQVQCREIKMYLCEKYSMISKLLVDMIARKARKKTMEIFQDYQRIQNKIKENPNNIEKLTDIKEFMQNLPNEVDKLKVETQKCFDIYKILDEFSYRGFQKEDLDRKWYVFGCPKDTFDLVAKRQKDMEKEKVKFQDEMKVSQEEFKESIDNLERTIQNFNQHQTLKSHAEIAQTAQDVNKYLAEFQEQARKFNSREALFDQEQTDYNKITLLQREFLPYSNLWITTNQWFTNSESWMKDELPTIDAVAAEKWVEEAIRILTGVCRFFKEKELQGVLRIATSIKQQIEEFKPKVPLLVALRKQGMKERHWLELKNRIGFVKPQPESEFTFTKVLEMGLMQNVDICVEVGEKAQKEYMIETMLDQMETMWEGINFQMLPYKSITFIIRGYDEIQQVLDEHIVNTQAMSFSPFKGPFEDRINNWNTTLKMTSDVLEEWCKCQGQWMYLQPIFDSPDIAKQLPAETKKFKTVDQTWKHTMTQAKTYAQVLRVCTQEGLLERLQEANKNLEIIQKELNNYLEKKREKFARFYFLSNDDLLEILSQTKEPTAVQPHLRKVFENINSIEFDDAKKIHAMYSAEGEKVGFVKLLDPNKKNVEDWMGEVEDMMKSSVRQALVNSVSDYLVKPRHEWVLLHPGQCVLNGSQILWTKEVEQAIKSNSVMEYWEKTLKTQINKLVELVRTKLTKQQQTTINALIVIDVHAKDVVEKLFKENVTDVSAFEWISQLRYYWENEDCFVKCVQTNFPYGYEYLGNTLRLVITPLTDKCYMTLMGALKLNLGGAPAGPAGTGKTESTKDLAKALAKQCVVFNCSDSMDYLMVGKFFKGLASAGAWCCFDEFNRINIEVLSVIAQQLLILFGEKAKGTPQIEFEGSIIKIQPTFSVFITMNPGYAGRTELPDNLKALFRGVAMMVPDYALIGEIMFYSFGFELGRELAKKMVATFKLSSEQLSSQDHYDYGMRAVRSVINAAGILKQQNPTMDEEQLLLRALRDVNVPKFLKDDLPLFENIINDLFPGVEKPVYSYGDLLEDLNICCQQQNLQNVKVFIDKCLQLYDTIQVRHGLMLVGPTGGGKTSTITTLQKAMSCKLKVHTHILNPKSITMGQLYGQFNEQTHEWTDGVLAYIVRETVKDESGEKHWVIFDGPVDALWIESMNTVLDDNKKLCLNSGQILTLTPYMTMMFEVEDLAVASPATVSRCGMVYMEPEALGYQVLIDSWINKLPETILVKSKIVKNKLINCFKQYLDPMIEFLRRSVVEIVTSSNNNLVQSLMRILDCYLAQYIDTELKKIMVEEMEQLEAALEKLFFFSLTWSIGATGNNRQGFNDTLKTLAKFDKPEDFYEVYLDIPTNTFIPWNQMYQNFNIDSKLAYHEIMIPTADSTRNMYLLKLLLSNNKNVLNPGLTGTGKTQNIFSLLTTGMGEDFLYIALTFSAQTSANQTQDTIDSKLEKRRKGVFGPPIRQRMIIFVDDLNMPKKEQYGAQPPLELLRQYLDYKGWYNRKELSFMKIEDVIILAAMGPPGGGLRHFNVIAYNELSNNYISEIFTSLITFFLKRFNEPIKNCIPTLVSSVLTFYQQVRSSMLPTPAKSHYTFNLRDIWRVFQGISSAAPKSTPDVVALVKIWYHENLRVFHDRLTTEEDRQELRNMLKMGFTQFGVTSEQVLDSERIIFGDFMQSRDADIKVYQQIPDMHQLVNRMDNYQEDYNTDNTFIIGGSKKQMRLVMFVDATEHISRIARIIRQPQGNALLLGVGGSGRQSLSRMATFVTNYKLFQIEVIKNYSMRSWREDVKKVLMIAGIENKPVTFLFCDTQIINEQMLEDLNNVLNSGDVTGIYQEKDFEDITQACKQECIKRQIPPTRMNIFTQYLIRVKKNIHLIIAMSPLGSQFTTRLRMFPSLVNCCTIDWFTEWPEEALVGVGKGQLADYEQELAIDGKIPVLVEMFKNLHKSVEKLSQKFLAELRRYNYVTPTSYLELLQLYRTILSDKRRDLNQQIQRLKGGLDKLIAANDAVEEIKITLKDMQPKLEQASIDTIKMMEKLKVDKQEADDTQRIVAREESEATKQQEEATQLATQAEASVADANRTLELTIVEVQKLRKEHLVEIKSLGSPPNAVKVTLAGVVILMQEYIKQNGGEIILTMKEGQIGGKKEENFFETARKYLLSDPQKLLDQLLKYDKDSTNPAHIKKLEEKVIPQPEFNIDAVKNCSFATKFLYMWVKAMYDYYRVYTETKPLRDQLIAMRKIVEEKTAELKIKKEELEKVNAKIRELEEMYNQKILEKEDLQNKMKECEIKLERAQKLTEGLSEEKERWGRDIKSLQAKVELLPGDAIVAAGMVAYSGPFTSHYRTQMEGDWVLKLGVVGVAHSEGVTMRQFLGDGVKIQAWNIAGLPKDDTSTENGIIIDKSRRWCLMIDPQNQANKFIKNMGRDNAEGIDVVKISDVNLMRTLELAIQFGKWVLLENVGRELDPSLEPILNQQLVKSGTSYTITIGDKQLTYNEKFKLYLTTTIPNPHYSPETFVKVTIINFAITASGLEEQMLAQIVALENPALEQKKIEIVKKNAADKKQLLAIEDSILKSLSDQKGDISEILLDETLINKLQTSKRFAAEINQRVKDSKITEAQIDEVRESYRPVAFRSSLLFFCITDLANIDPMYQYSLQWFTKLFVLGVENALPSSVIEERLKNLNDYFTYSLYENICRSLFERHKLLFSFMLCIKILQGAQMMDDKQWRYLLAGPQGDIKIAQNPTAWISDNSWPDIYRQIKGVSTIDAFKGFDQFFMDNTDQFKGIWDSSQPQKEQLPEPWQGQLTQFEKLIFLKALRPDKLVPAIQDYIDQQLNPKFTIPPTFDLEKCYKDSSPMSPLIFVLSAGSDPVADFLKFADEQNMAKRFDSISLGQGQGPKAERMVKDAIQRGGWVLLQNCHLAISWMNDLERICEELNENIHKDFRLWLTSMPSNSFPIPVLQNSVKMTIEPPQGIRANLMRTYKNLDDKELSDCTKQDIFKKLLFGFCLFHAIIQDRRKFGAIGWNIPYEFTNEDLTVCKRQLKMLLDEYDKVPYKVIQYLGAEINYGGRVTDDKDVRLIKTIIKKYICHEALRDGYKFSESGIYVSLASTNQEGYLNYIDQLPLNPDPEAFGMHENAEITNSQNTTRILLETVLSIQPRQSSGTGKSREETIEEIATFVQSRTPEVLPFDDIFKKYPTSYEESMNTVLVQEVIRYNRLLAAMKESLINVKKALKGQIVMSDELESLANSLFDNQVPLMWADKGFLSLKPLSSWTNDLSARINFLQSWIDNGTPKVFWISGFFFPQAFLTGSLQNYARRHVIAIDKLNYEFKILDTLSPQDIEEKPEDGCYIFGISLEGIRWDYKKHYITHPRQKELYSELPLVWLLPCIEKEYPKDLVIYQCPLYKVVSRAGTLSTTGHSTNFVTFLELPSKDSEEQWIRAGAAAFLSLRY
ncbi:unnamed protein product [Paramecium pentaurelia]|uniref:Dynein heavy chain n=1 Tax=Paramecium pentaurelia TaxID=43138 RepID=A0A8S1TYP8_9CILI|nr:unnamed protein product [Paramecium pentaurelia]